MIQECQEAFSQCLSSAVVALLHCYPSQVSPLFQFLGIESGSMEVNHLVTNFHFKTLNVNKATFIYLLCVCWCVCVGGHICAMAPWRPKGQLSGVGSLFHLFWGGVSHF